MTFPNTTFISKVTVITQVWAQAVNDYIVGLATSAGATLIGTVFGTLDTALYQIGLGPATTTFNVDGSITETRGTLTVVTSFAPNAVTETYSGPLSKVITTTFNADGTISRTEV